MAEPAWVIERLDASHERSGFDCGKPLLNDWLRRFAGQYDRRNLARTYVAVRAGERRVLGYYAISNHQVIYDILPDEEARGLPSIDVPVVLLGRLAIDMSVQGQGIGSDLLVDALRRADYISQQIGVRAVEVHAIDEDASRFYQKFGFVSLKDHPEHLYLPMQVIRKLDI